MLSTWLGALLWLGCGGDDAPQPTTCGEMCARIYECGGHYSVGTREGFGECAKDCNAAPAARTAALRSCAGHHTCREFAVCIADHATSSIGPG
jgi:hypothetical protein